MVKSSFSEIAKEIIVKISPTYQEIESMQKSVVSFKEGFGKVLNSLNIDAEIFVGGSFAKKTIVRKKEYDVDVFVRFDKKYVEENISEITEKILKTMKVNYEIIHGSRDYFRLRSSENSGFYLEIVPVIKVKKPEEALNITDLSYSHVKYVNKKIKKDEVLGDIRLAKEFARAHHCYGAESYISGFSGYGLELLVHYYGSFMKFVKEMAKDSKDKIIIDLEKHYRTKKNVLLDVNSSKLNSPIILIDPVYKQRNVLAALSEETFERFREACNKFLKSPSLDDFEIQKTDLNKIKSDADKKRMEFILIQISTDKQEGDVAGSKLLKFYNHLALEIGEFFDVKDKGFNYNEKQDARCYFVGKSKGEIILEGPSVEDNKNVEAFFKEHKEHFTKSGKVYAREKLNFDLKEFLKKWKNDNKTKMVDMTITSLKEVDI